MISQTPDFSPEVAGRLAAVSIDSGAALTLCGILLEVLAQMPQARPLICAALERPAHAQAEHDAAGRAAEMIALGRLREAVEAQEMRAAA